MLRTICCTIESLTYHVNRHTIDVVLQRKLREQTTANVSHPVVGWLWNLVGHLDPRQCSTDDVNDGLRETPDVPPTWI